MISQKNNSSFSPTKLRILFILILLLGVFFRLINLDRKIISNEESASVLRITGHTWAETEQLYNGQVIAVEDLQKYQRFSPDKSVVNTVRGLAAEEPQHTPLYFAIARGWVQWFGNSMATYRSVAAILSLLVFPCLYWLCRELFESSLPGWVAIALVAVSPFHVMYAQDIRQYSLWAATILLSSAALLRAMRIKSKFSWAIYGATLLLGLYTYLFSVFIIIGHGIYAIVMERFRFSKTVKAFLIATLTAIIFFVPWLFIVASNISQINSTTSWIQDEGWVIGGTGSKLSLVAKLMRNLSLIFLDADNERRIIYFGFDNLFTYLIQIFFVLALVTLSVYSIYFVGRHASKKVRVFLLTLIGVTALALILPDLILGGMRSNTTRYMTPCYLGIQIAIAYLIVSKISSVSIKNRAHQHLWRLVIATVLSLGVFSCTVNAQAQTWWNKHETYYDSDMAQIINQATHPLVVCVGVSSVSRALPFSYLLEQKVRLQLIEEPILPKISNSFSDVFLYRPAEALLSKLEKQQTYKLESAYQYFKNWLGQKESAVLLWKLKRT